MARDVFDRPLGNLRLSVTDRCNLRCAYCMPETDYVWLPRRDVLTFEELDTVVAAFVSLGVERVRLTGGEPLLRRDLSELAGLLVRRPGVREVALTTNGILLREQAPALRAAGLHRVTVSLDTLQPERFRTLTRRDDLRRVLEGIAAARDAGFAGLKLDTVVMRGTNDDEVLDLLEFAKSQCTEIRFIEYMDVGGATQWSRERVVSGAEIVARIQQRYGFATPLPERGSAPAERFRLPDGTVFGVIASTTAPFCGACDRSRVTADGHLYTCLYATQGLDLRAPLRAGASVADLAALVGAQWAGRRDRGAEDRLRIRDRAALVSADTLRQNPRLEMHTRGG